MAKPEKRQKFPRLKFPINNPAARIKKEMTELTMITTQTPTSNQFNLHHRQTFNEHLLETF